MTDQLLYVALGVLLGLEHTSMWCWFQVCMDFAETPKAHDNAV